MLVEDEAGVRSYVHKTLEAHGYRVLNASTGIEAIEISERYAGQIHLLLTDIVLPGMKGPEIMRRFGVLRPGIRFLCMSGYPERFGTLMHAGTPYLQKPFTLQLLLSRVRETLDDRD